MDKKDEAFRPRLLGNDPSPLPRGHARKGRGGRAHATPLRPRQRGYAGEGVLRPVDCYDVTPHLGML